jgi:hypothetical protein
VARIARRFAAAWQTWDAGRRPSHLARILRRLSVAALWDRLRAERARPTATPPPRWALQRVELLAIGRGTWRAAVLARHPAGAYLATLVILATPAGPRVAEIER